MSNTPDSQTMVSINDVRDVLENFDWDTYGVDLSVVCAEDVVDDLLITLQTFAAENKRAGGSV